MTKTTIIILLHYMHKYKNIAITRYFNKYIIYSKFKQRLNQANECYKTAVTKKLENTG